MLRIAIASGEVRSGSRDGGSVLLLVDDGIVGMRPGHQNEPILYYNKDDLMDWLNRQAPQTQTQQTGHRYASDGQLIKKGRQMVARGMSKRQAAARLAPKAEGGSIDQRIERLRKLI